MIIMGIVNKATDKYQKCIDACNRCAQACIECMKMCVNETNVSARGKCIAKLNECACICKEASSFMSMDAQHAMDLCKLCEVICNECANECDMFKDDHCKKCATECRSCANECKMMTGA